MRFILLFLLWQQWTFCLRGDFKHIANGAMMKQIGRVCSDNGFECPQLLTPQQLLGDYDVD